MGNGGPENQKLRDPREVAAVQLPGTEVNVVGEPTAESFTSDTHRISSFRTVYEPTDRLVFPSHVLDRETLRSSGFEAPVEPFSMNPRSELEEMFNSRLEDLGISKIGAYAVIPEHDKGYGELSAISAVDNSMHRLTFSSGNVMYRMTDSTVIRDATNWLTNGQASFKDATLLFNGTTHRLEFMPSAAFERDSFELLFGATPLEAGFDHTYSSVFTSNGKPTMVFDSFEQPISRAVYSRFRFADETYAAQVDIRTVPGVENFAGIKAEAIRNDIQHQLSVGYRQFNPLQSELPPGQEISMLFSAERNRPSDTIKLDVSGRYLDNQVDVPSWQLQLLLQRAY